jgi:hypothetical protein
LQSGRQGLNLNLVVAVGEAKDDGRVGVTGEAIGRIEMLKACLGSGGIDNILPDGMARAPVGKGEFSAHQRLGQGIQVSKVVGRQLLVVPQIGLAGVGIEIAQVKLAQGGPVVVAGNADVLSRAQELNTGVGVRTVAYDVSETPYCIYRSNVIENCLEGFQVAVNVGKNQVAHTMSFV